MTHIFIKPFSLQYFTPLDRFEHMRLTIVGDRMHKKIFFQCILTIVLAYLCSSVSASDAHKNGKRQYPRTCPKDESKESTEVFVIKPECTQKPFIVKCYLAEGWIIILDRSDGSQNFDRTWLDYKRGFGNVRGEYWLGLDKIYEMTKCESYEMYIMLAVQPSVFQYIRYEQFAIGSELESYRLKLLGGYQGSWRLEGFLSAAGMPFTNYDRDFDEYEEANCARTFHGAWWYDCGKSSPTGAYNGSERSRWHWNHQWLYAIRIMIRPKRWVV